MPSNIALFSDLPTHQVEIASRRMTILYLTFDSSLFNIFTLTVMTVWRYHKCEWSLHRTNTSVLQPFLQIGDNQGQGRRMRTLQLLPLFDGHEHVRTLWVLQQNLVKKTCPSTVYMVTTYVMTSVFLHVLYCCATYCSRCVVFTLHHLVMIVTTGHRFLLRLMLATNNTIVLVIICNILALG